MLGSRVNKEQVIGISALGTGCMQVKVAFGSIMCGLSAVWTQSSLLLSDKHCFL